VDVPNIDDVTPALTQDRKPPPMRSNPIMTKPTDRRNFKNPIFTSPFSVHMVGTSMNFIGYLVKECHNRAAIETMTNSFNKAIVNLCLTSELDLRMPRIQQEVPTARIISRRILYVYR